MFDQFLQENTRLQSKVLKLDLGGSPQESSGAEKALATVQAENAELRDDNDKLVNYLEGLEKRKQDLEDQVMNNAGKILISLVWNFFPNLMDQSLLHLLFLAASGVSPWDFLSVLACVCLA